MKEVRAVLAGALVLRTSIRKTLTLMILAVALHSAARYRLGSQIKPIHDSHALSVGADLVSQSFLLTVALGLVLLEYYRSSVASAAAAESKQMEKDARSALKEARLRAIEQSIEDLKHRLDESTHARSWPLTFGLSGSNSSRPTEHAHIATPPPPSAKLGSDSAASIAKGTATTSSVSSSAASTLHTIAPPTPLPLNPQSLSPEEDAYISALRSSLAVEGDPVEVDAGVENRPPSTGGWWGWLFGSGNRRSVSRDPAAMGAVRGATGTKAKSLELA